MQKRRNRKLLPIILCMALTVATALFTTGCNGSKESGAPAGAQAQAESGPEAEIDAESAVDTEAAKADAEPAADTEAEAAAELAADQETETVKGSTEAVSEAGSVSQLGEGSVKFSFTVVDKEGAKTRYEIHTDKETVGEALAELGLIAGEESEYGLYVKTVDGVTADYDKDGVYWAFYVDGEYGQTGVDATPVAEGGDYAFKMEAQ